MLHEEYRGHLITVQKRNEIVTFIGGQFNMEVIDVFIDGFDVSKKIVGNTQEFLMEDAKGLIDLFLPLSINKH